MSTKIFVSILVVEGKADIPSGTSELDFKDENVYKRIAEY